MSKRFVNLSIYTIMRIRTHHCIIRKLSVSPQFKLNDLNFQNEKLQKFLESLRKEYYNLQTDTVALQSSSKRITLLPEVVKLIEKYRDFQKYLIPIEEIVTENDKEMKELIIEENQMYANLIKKTECELIKKIENMLDGEYCLSLIFEINAGVGGQEAMLFSKDLFNMYTNYFEYNKWDYQIINEEITDIGGLRYANIEINNEIAFGILRYEAGVHRIQRVPYTEKYGRIHTSTASVTVIPKPLNVNIQILEKDLKIETKRSSGAGGQHVNTTDSAVRIIHLPTGLTVENQTDRSQIKNKEIALEKLRTKLHTQQLLSGEQFVKSTRKTQQGNLQRNEKIRTYNFVQDRITDHRLKNGTIRNLQAFFDGGEYLDKFLQQLVSKKRKENLCKYLDQWNDK